MQIKNNKPCILYKPLTILPEIDVTLPSNEYLDEIQAYIKATYVDPLFVSMNNQPVTLTDKNGNNITPDGLTNAIWDVFTNPVMDVNLQDELSEIYRQVSIYNTPNNWLFEEQLMVEALTKHKLPLPSDGAGGKPVVKYTAQGDLIPSAKLFLASQDADGASHWFANLSGYLKDKPVNNYITVTVRDAQVFEDLKTTMNNFVQIWSVKHNIDPDVSKLIADFNNITLKDMSSGFFLPNGGGRNTAEIQALSFTRILLHSLAVHEKTHPGILTVQPGNLSEVFFPENILILNLEEYAHATPKDITKDWDTFEKALQAKKVLNFVSNKKLIKTKAVAKSMSQASKASSAGNQGAPLQRVKIKPFSGKPIPAKKLRDLMRHIIQSQITKQITSNTYKTQKMSFMRANRRRPDDINAMGKLTTVNYRPDIHIYLDTSGSISESQYRDAVMNLIHLTKGISCDLYITSFSHYVSQSTLLKTKDRSASDIYKDFLKIPKVDGGTDFSQVWNKIDALDAWNQKASRSHQLNFIITDFGYNISRNQKFYKDQASVKNTYYVPISADTRTWKYMMQWADEFRKACAKAGDYGIRKRILM